MVPVSVQNQSVDLIHWHASSYGTFSLLLKVQKVYTRSLPLKFFVNGKFNEKKSTFSVKRKMQWADTVPSKAQTVGQAVELTEKLRNELCINPQPSEQTQRKLISVLKAIKLRVVEFPLEAKKQFLTTLIEFWDKISPNIAREAILESLDVLKYFDASNLVRAKWVNY
jgi:hypothetical protein